MLAKDALEEFGADFPKWGETKKRGSKTGNFSFESHYDELGFTELESNIGK